MPNKKSAGRKPRRTRRKKSAKLTRIALFTIGFIALMSLGVYGLYLLKSGVSENGISDLELSAAISNTDSALNAAYFDMGVSSKNVSSKKLKQKESADIAWEYKDIIIEAPRKLSKNKVKQSLSASFDTVPGLIAKFKDGDRSTTVLLSVSDIETHRIKFNFKPQEKTVKKEKKADTKDREDLEKKTQKKADKKSGKLSEHIEEYKKSYSTKPKIVIIIDDIGMNKSPVDKLLDINAPITLAVLPNLPYSEYAALEAHKKGREVMLHLPMEPKESSGYTAFDAGEDALIVGLPKAEIRNRIGRNISSVPHIMGVNNHMGSKFMENDELLELVMQALKQNDLFFVDSMTSGASVGSETASKYGVRSVERDVFLDDSSKGASYVKSQLKKLVKLSHKKGYAVGIAHPYPGTVEALTQMMPTISSEVEIATVSQILDHSIQIGKNNRE